MSIYIFKLYEKQTPKLSIRLFDGYLSWKILGLLMPFNQEPRCRNNFNPICWVCYDYKCERHILSVQRKEENNKTAFAVFALQILNQFLK